MSGLAKLWVSILAAFLCSLFACYAIMPGVIKLANKIGAVDIPRDNRRMHKVPVPRMGGLGIFFAFVLTVFIFASKDRQLYGILTGAVILIILGIVDDIKDLKPGTKLIFQALASLFPVLNGVIVERMSNFLYPLIPSASKFIEFGIFSVPLTIIWIVGIINAVNWIDGLDGLACGIAGIASVCMLTISLVLNDMTGSLIMAALTGACFGFFPYNRNPARIFMGDTGSMFLGYILATMSIQGLFKLYALISFVVPLLVLALPLLDLIRNIARRILQGKSPFAADRGHIHHRLIDIGLNQKQAVIFLYYVSAILGCLAVVFSTHGVIRAVIFIILCIFSIAFSLYIYFIYKKNKTNIRR